MDSAIRRRRLLGKSILAGSLAASPSSLWAQVDKVVGEGAPSACSSITVGVMQQAREPELDANRDKIVRFMGQAKASGCRLVVFPEDALGSPVGTPNEDLEEAVDVIREGSLVYPARAVGYDGIVPTIRLKALRDAIEDYEYLAILRRLDKSGEAMRVVRRLTPSWFQWDKDPAAYEKARAELAEMIEATARPQSGQEGRGDEL